MLFSTLAFYFSQLEKTPSRLKKVEYLSKLFLEDSIEIDKIIYLAQGTISASYQKVDFNIGASLIKKALSKTFSLSIREIESHYNNLGDLGDVASIIAADVGQRNIGSVTITQVFEVLVKIINISGKDTISRKLDILVPLFDKLENDSLRYVIRILLSNLRLGFSDRTILDALSKSFTGDTKSRKNIEKAFYRCSDLGRIAQVLALDGIQAMDKITLIPLFPLFPKLVQRASSMDEVILRMSANSTIVITTIEKNTTNSLNNILSLQPKFDGLRAQIHKNENEVKIFSRKLEELTLMFPELVSEARSLPYKSFIIDTEIIGYNEETKIYALFQETIKRKRKYDIEDTAQQVPIIANAFDLLYLDGIDLTRQTFLQRFSQLDQILHSSNNKKKIILIENIYPQDAIEAEEYFLEQINRKLEGVIAKNPLSVYDPGTRNFEWIKLKRASVDNLNDTIDCVILGYDYGNGQRTKFGIGAILVGVFNENTENFETIAKIGSGLKDDDLIQLKTMLDTIAIKTMPLNEIIDKRCLPNILVIPQIVVEVKADEITKSIMHTAGRDKEGFGYALRFPRLIKIRHDKGVADITKVSEIENISGKKIDKIQSE